MMLVFLTWSRDDRAAISGRSWFERARQENLATLVASRQPAAAAGADVAGIAAAGAGKAASRSTIDDDEHLAAYNAYLAGLHQPPRPGPS